MARVPRGGGDLHKKGVGMHIVSLRGVHVNFRFWSHLGCSGEKIMSL